MSNLDMERMMYLVAPTADQCEWDEDGPVNRDLFVWAKDASEAVKLWRDYYDLVEDEEEHPLGVTERVRVFEAPVMDAKRVRTSTAVGWGDIFTYGATLTERSEI